MGSLAIYGQVSMKDNLQKIEHEGIKYTKPKMKRKQKLGLVISVHALTEELALKNTTSGSVQRRERVKS